MSTLVDLKTNKEVDMNIFKASLIAASVGLAFAPSLASAQDMESSAQDANKYLEQIGNTVVTQELIDEAREANKIRDQLRDRSELESLEDQAITSEISKLTSKRDLITLQFIVDNVPAHILAAGQNEVQAYIQHNFISENNNAGGGEIKQEPKTLWESTDSALTTPYEDNSPWVPVVRDASSPSTDPTSIEKPEDPIDTALESGEKAPSITNEESESLDALGITQEELESMFGELPQTGSESKKKGKPEADPGSNVTIDSIEVERIVIMGKSSYITPIVKMTVIRGSEARKIQRKFDKISVGYEFEVDDNAFRLESLTSDSVVFVNLKTETYYEESVK